MKKYRATFYVLERNTEGVEKYANKGSIEFFIFGDQNPTATAFKRADTEQQKANVCELEII